MPDPVGARTAVRLPVGHGFAIGHPVDVCAVGRGLDGAVALRHHLDPIHLLALGQLCPVLNVQVFKTEKEKRTKNKIKQNPPCWRGIMTRTIWRCFILTRMVFGAQYFGAVFGGLARPITKPNWFPNSVCVCFHLCCAVAVMWDQIGEETKQNKTQQANHNTGHL